MALRTIRIQGDPVLTKVCRPIPEVTDRIRTLAEDMLETMYDAYGVGCRFFPLPFGLSGWLITPTIS